MDNSSSNTPPTRLNQSVTLPISQRVVPNRLVKSALTESLANGNDDGFIPNERHFRLYQQWAGCGMVITGNVMVDRHCKENPRNVVLDKETAQYYDSDLQHFQKWAKCIQQKQNDNENSSSSLAIMQLSHAGRQCPLSVTGWFQSPVAPSGGSRGKLCFPGGRLGRVVGNVVVRPPRELSVTEIQKVIIPQFVTAARLAYEQGKFDGVQIHAAHGYLLSQFLSPSGNLRTDEYGGSPEKRRRLLLEIIQAVRQAVTDPNFILGVKINHRDRSSDGIDREEECVELVHALSELEMVDFIELSSGSYEDTMFVKNVKENQTNGFFRSLAEKLSQQKGKKNSNINKKQQPLIVLTGGLRCVDAMESAIEQGIADLVGLGRPFCVHPTIHKDILGGRVSKIHSRSLSIPGIQHLQALSESALNNLWHQRQLWLLSEGKEPNPNISILWTVTVTFVWMYIWDPKLTLLWCRRWWTQKQQSAGDDTAKKES